MIRGSENLVSGGPPVVFTHPFQNSITKLIWDTHARGVLSRKKQLDDLIVISCQVKLRRGKVIFSLLEEIKTEDPIVQGFKIQNNTLIENMVLFQRVNSLLNSSFLLLI